MSPIEKADSVTRSRSTPARRLVAQPSRAAHGSLLALALAVGLGGQATADDLPLQGNSVVHFASRSEAQDILGGRDEFVRAMTPLDRRLRLQSDAPVDEATYLEFARQQAREWTQDERDLIRQALDLIRPRLAGLKSVWPDTISLVKSTGQEEAQAPHCRGNAVVLPRGHLGQSPDALQALLAHELFHILSRQSPELRRSMYSIVGCQLCDPIALPASLKDRKITNPDAPSINAVLTVSHEGEPLRVTPLVISKQTAYESLRQRTLFGELIFRLAEVEPHEGGWKVREAPGPELWTPEQLPDYYRQVGRNTGYIIHPEEVLADNFMFLVTEKTELPDPWVVDRLRQLLSR